LRWARGIGRTGFNHVNGVIVDDFGNTQHAPSVRAITAFTLAYVAAGLVLALPGGNWIVVFYIFRPVGGCYPMDRPRCG
jgi:hypothetical protein